jgi:hypothetical protein
MSVRTDTEPIAPEDYTRFKFFFLRRDEDGRWHRDATPVYETPTFDTAYEQFWFDADRPNLLYSGCLNGDLADETANYFEYGDQFVYEPYEYDAYIQAFDDSPALPSWFTVFGVWDTGDGWCRNVEHIQARNAVHAELIWRAQRIDTGDVLVAAVVAGKRLGIEYEGRLYATQSGHRVGSDEENELDRIEAVLHPPQRRFWRRK